MLCALNCTLRSRRRRLAMLAVMLGLAGVVVGTHGAMNLDHMGDAAAMCVAVAETAVVAAGAALALGARMRRPLWLIPAPLEPEPASFPSPSGVRARAGPPLLQVLRL